MNDPLVSAMIYPTREQILNTRLLRVSHSQLSEPEFVLEGIGPAQFRSHFLLLDNGLVIDLFIAEMTLSSSDKMVVDGETDGIPVRDLLTRTITHVWNDDTLSCIVILDNDIYLKDANDGVYGNPLRAGYIYEDYKKSEIDEFTDYWNQSPINGDRTMRSTEVADRPFPDG